VRLWAGLAFREGQPGKEFELDGRGLSGLRPQGWALRDEDVRTIPRSPGEIGGSMSEDVYRMMVSEEEFLYVWEQQEKRAGRTIPIAARREFLIDFWRESVARFSDVCEFRVAEDGSGKHLFRECAVADFEHDAILKRREKHKAEMELRKRMIEED
jgi:hypothetical protein